MSVKLKALLVISAIVAVISLSSMGAGLYFSEQRLRDAVEGEMTLFSRIVDELITSELGRWKSEADSVAVRILGADEARRKELLWEQARLRGFISVTLFEADGNVISYGVSAPGASYRESAAVRRAFAGESLVAGDVGLSGEPLFRVVVPGEAGSVLASTLPGTSLNNIVAGLTIWDSGSVFILDKDGTIIGSSNSSLVLERRNFIRMAESDPSYASAAAMHSKIISGGSGVGGYDYHGVPRICAYRPIQGSVSGWSLGVISPAGESPATRIQQIQIVSAVIFLTLGFIAAFFAAGAIARPFNKIEEQNLRLATLSAAKSSFLANMSHEMRTPLNAIIGLSELALEEQELRGGVREYVMKAHDAGLTLLGIINDILDISKIESGRFEIIPARYALASLINDTVTLNTMRIGDKPIRFSLKLAAGLPANLFGDELRIKQIFNNLLSNAFKYTNKGFVEWRISCLRDGDDLWLCSSVEDSGIGIKKEDMARLFTAYNRLDTDNIRYMEGTGLGLSITRRMAEMMDGEVTLKSEYGKGSVFSVRLRQGFVDDVLLGEETAASLSNFQYLVEKRDKSSAVKRRPMPYAKVLVVDDVPSNLEVARGMLKPYKLAVVDCVESGLRAVELVREAGTKYDIIFMDHMMPDMDGLEAVRVIREEIDTDYARKVPIIALTANALAGNEEMFLKRGFQAFLSKPINMPRLNMIMESWVRREVETTDAGAVIEAGEVVPAETSQDALPVFFERWQVEGMNVAAGLGLFGGDADAFLAVIRSYAGHTPGLLEQLRACSRENLPAYAVAVHGLKGSSYSIGAERVGRKAEELEQAAKAGDFALVSAHNPEVISMTQTLLQDISDCLAGLGAEAQRPRQAAPDQAVLDKLLDAARGYDMAGMDSALLELEGFEYEQEGEEFVSWLKGQALLSNFQQIQERLEAEQKCRAGASTA